MKHSSGNDEFNELESDSESSIDETLDNNNMIILQNGSANYKNFKKTKNICKHMKEIDGAHLSDRKNKNMHCDVCGKKAQLFCAHENCTDACFCSEINHISDHTKIFDHSVIVHQDGHVVFCTQCNVQVPLRQLLKSCGIPSVTPVAETMNDSPIMLEAVMGYVNFGNTCYMNAVFQLLGHCSPFSEYFTTLTVPDELNNSQAASRSTAIQLALDFRMMWSPIPIPFLSPWRIIQCIRAEMPSFESFQQQDAAEFLRALLDILDRELKLFQEFEEFESGMHSELFNEHDNESEKHAKMTIITDTFQGSLENQIQCHLCGFRSRTFENFLDLSVPILSEAEELQHFLPQNFIEQDETVLLPREHPLEGEEGNDPGFLVHSRRKHKTNLIECMDRYFQKINLQGDNQYSCSKCNRLVDATKSTKIVTLPEVIMIQLKRFRHTMYGTRKVDKVVEFPVRSLDFGRWMANDDHSIYDLSGFVVHEGHNVEFGHYVTYCRHEHDKMWYKFDDLNITKCEVSKVAEQQPYILMFKRRHFVKSNPARIRRPTESQYNSSQADKRYKEQCRDAWSIVEGFLEGKTDRTTNLEKFVIENSGLLSDELSLNDPEQIYETLNRMLVDIKTSMKMNKNSKNKNAMSANNTSEAIDKLVRSMDEWFKKILKREWIEKKVMQMEKRSSSKQANGSDAKEVLKTCESQAKK